MPNAKQTPPSSSSEFLRSLAQGVVLGLVLLCGVLAWMWTHPARQAPAVAPMQPPVASIAPPVRAPQAPTHGPLADFHGKTVSPDVQLVANWSFFTRDNQGHSVVILDKKAATLHVFDPAGHLVASSPVLLGLAIGDDTEPGLGDKPLSQIRDDEKTTPAGRFVAERGENTDGEDIVWFDYDQALAMHRVVRGTPAERRAQRLASPDPKERRISFGCVNLVPAFYDKVLSPTVKHTGAIIYVLPEVKTAQQVFGAWDVTDPSAQPPAQAYARSAPAVQEEGERAPRKYREEPATVAAEATTAQ